MNLSAEKKSYEGCQGPQTSTNLDTPTHDHRCITSTDIDTSCSTSSSASIRSRSNTASTNPSPSAAPIVDHTVTPNRDDIIRLLRKAEQDVNRHSWDQPARLVELRWTGATLSTRRTPSTVRPPIGMYLRFVADRMRTSPAGRALAVGMAEQSVVGIALFCESWSNSELSIEQARDLTVSLADTPGSYESRDVAAIDIYGNAYGIHRRRGHKPVEAHADLPLAGEIMRGLRDIMLTVAEHVPAGQADLDALRALRILDMNEAMNMIAARRSRAEHDRGGDEQQPDSEH